MTGEAQGAPEREKFGPHCECCARMSQVAEQRALAEPADALVEDCTPWMTGDAQGAPELLPAEEQLDSETQSLLQNQRQYYDSVHAIKEQVEASTFCYLKSNT